MTFDNLTSISPIDGRYSDKTSPLKAIFSEFGLIKYRLLVEVRWLEAMSNNPHIPEVPTFSPQSNAALLAIAKNFSLGAYDRGTLIFCKGFPLESNLLIFTLLNIVPNAITVLRIFL